MTVNNPQNLIIDLLINLTVEQTALINMLATEYIRHTNEEINELNEALRESRAVARKNLTAQIQNGYGGMGSIDDLLKSAL